MAATAYDTLTYPSMAARTERLAEWLGFEPTVRLPGQQP